MQAIRLSFPYERLVKTFSKIKDVCQKVVVYEHDATRVHVHALLVGLTVSTDTLKNWIRKEVGQVAKSDWSFVTAHNEDFITYMSKGILAPLFVYGYQDEELESFRTKWIPQESKKKTLVQYKLKIENPREQRLRQEDMVKQIVQRYKAGNVQSASVLINLIRQVVVIENRTVLGRYKLRDYYDTVMAIAFPESWVDKMESFVAFRI